MLIVIAHVENGESAEWQDEDDVGVTGLSVTENDVAENGLPFVQWTVTSRRRGLQNEQAQNSA